jgi:hypothetical protein
VSFLGPTLGRARLARSRPRCVDRQRSGARWPGASRELGQAMCSRNHVGYSICRDMFQIGVRPRNVPGWPRRPDTPPAVESVTAQRVLRQSHFVFAISDPALIVFRPEKISLPAK